MIVHFMQYTKARQLPACGKTSKVKAGFHGSYTGHAVIVGKYESCGTVLHRFNFIR